MKILHISALPVWSMEGKGGMPSLRETIEGHIRAKHEIHLILPRYDLFSDDLSPLTISKDVEYGVSIAQCRWIPVIKKIRKSVKSLSAMATILYPFRWILNLTTMLCLTVSFLIEASKVHREGFVPQLIYAHNQYAALSGYLLGLLWRTPNITRLYGTFLADLIKKPFVAIRYPTAAAGYLVPSKLLICANDGTRGDEVAQKFNISAERFRFWQNGVAPPSTVPEHDRGVFLERFGSTLRADNKWVISCSRLSYWKRIDRMIHAMRICKDMGKNCQLLIAGEGPESPKLKRLAEELEVNEYVVWLGALAHDDIWALMKAADIFIITNDVTNRCNPLYEAAWAGLPIVSVYDPSTSDLLVHNRNALLAPKDDITSLGQNLAELCTNSTLADKLKAGQRKLSESFWSWEERMRTEVAELEKLVATNPEKDNQNRRW